MKITIKADRFECKPAMNPLQITNQLLATVMAVYKSDIDACPKDKQQELTDHFYDNFNLMASEFLALLDPNRELRPDLTAEAIMKAEEELLADKGE